jgi:hypothetical protein
MNEVRQFATKKKHRNELPHYHLIRPLFKHASYELEWGADSKALFLRFVEESFVLIKKKSQSMDNERNWYTSHSEKKCRGLTYSWARHHHINGKERAFSHIQSLKRICEVIHTLGTGNSSDDHRSPSVWLYIAWKFYTEGLRIKVQTS